MAWGDKVDFRIAGASRYDRTVERVLLAIGRDQFPIRAIDRGGVVDMIAIPLKKTASVNRDFVLSGDLAQGGTNRIQFDRLWWVVGIPWVSPNSVHVGKIFWQDDELSAQNYQSGI